MENCIFCKIVRGEIPSYKVYEDAKVLAFLDIHPGNAGHTLIIPKKHAENIFEVTPEDWAAVAEAARLLSIAVEKAVHADGINIKMNNREHGGQDVMHAHVHVVPRFKGDGVVKPIVQQSSYKKGEAEEVQKKIKAAL